MGINMPEKQQNNNGVLPEDLQKEPVINIANTNVNENAGFSGGFNLFDSLTTGGSSSLGLFDNDGSQYTEYFQKLKESLDKKLKAIEANNGVETDVVVIPAQNEFGKIPYSTLVLSSIFKSTCYYYFFQFTNTGKLAMTAGEIMDVYNHNKALRNNPGMMKDNMKPYRLYDGVPGDKFRQIIKESLSKHYGNKYANSQITFKSLQGTNLGPKVAELAPDKMADIILSIGYNQIRMDIGRSISPDKFEINVKEITSNQDWKAMINVALLGIPKREEDRGTNYAGDFIRTDFEGQVVLEKATSKDNAKAQDLVVMNDSRPVADFAGYISALPGPSQVRDPQTGAYYDCIRLMPHIILTQLQGFQRTPNLTLLSLVSAGVMFSKENYLACIKNLVNTDTNCPGKYNLICNVTREDHSKVAAIDFKNTKVWTEEAIVNCLDNMFALQPVISADFSPYGDQGTIDSIFAYASRTDIKSNVRQKYLDKIVSMCHEFTSGAFPANYNTSEIFSRGAVPVPQGYFTDTTGVKDIRCIDLATVLSYYKGNDAVLKQWLFSEVPEFNGDFDPFFAKVDIIANVIGARDAIITGRGVRVTFHPNFIKTLTDAVTAAGFVPEYKPFGVNPLAKSLFEGMGTLFSNAGLAQGYTFGQKFSYGNPVQGAGTMFYGGTMM